MKGAKQEFDFEKRGRTIKDVSRAEKMAAMNVLVGWLTKELAGKTSSGCFSEEAIGMPAVRYFACIAYGKIFNGGGNWTWKENNKLTTLLCKCANTEMVHWVRKWKTLKDKEKLEPTPVSYYAYPENLLDRLATNPEDEDKLSDEEREAADEQAEKDRVIGFDEALEIVKDDPKLVKFVKAVRDLETRRQIEKRLKIKVDQYFELEAELLERLKMESRLRPPKRRAI